MSLLRRLAAFFGTPIRLPGFGTVLLGAYALIPDTDARIQFWRDKGLPMMAPYLASPWTGIILVAIGLIWLWFFRGVIHVHHGSLTAQTKPIASLQMEVVRAVPPQDQNPPVPVEAVKWVPDWPIRNLFFRLNPSLQQSKNRADFDALADEIIDKLSTGQILSWGRAIGEARTLPLFPIPDDYWLHAKLNIWLLDDDGGDILQASPVSLSAPNKTQYREILINRAQALAEWPKIAVPVERDTKLGDALAYVVTGNWDRKALWENEGGAISAAGSALKEFEQLASDGVLQVWGMRTRNLGPHVKIPSEYWETHHVHYMSLFKESADASSYVSVSQEPDYFDLKVSKAQFEVRWPR